MGGKAFARYSPKPLPTPRLPPALYYNLRSKYISLLSSLFTHVASPIEAPEKVDHGDVDILVSGPDLTQLALLTGYNTSSSHHKKTSDPSQLRELEVKAVKELLTHAGAIYTDGTLNLAVSHPDIPECYVQLDVNFQSSYNHWRWLLFMHSHGDFFSLLGIGLRRVGLVATDKGFFARDIDIERHDKKKSMIFLTDEPTELIEFLGLDQKYWIPEAKEDVLTSMDSVDRFKNNIELFQQVTKSRFFAPRPYLRAALKTTDRNRLGTRDQYRLFVEAFVPTLPDANLEVYGNESEVDAEVRHALEDQHRLIVFHEALTRWNRHAEWRRTKANFEKDYIENLTKRKWNEQRRYLNSELNRYVDAWTTWCGFNTVDAVITAGDTGCSSKKSKKVSKPVRIASTAGVVVMEHA